MSHFPCFQQEENQFNRPCSEKERRTFIICTLNAETTYFKVKYKWSHESRISLVFVTLQDANRRDMGGYYKWMIDECIWGESTVGFVTN